MPTYIIETESKFRHTYIVVADSAKDARNFEKHIAVPQELTQEHLGEKIKKVSQVTPAELKKAHRQSDHYYLPIKRLTHVVR